jgi:hypothetical protein
MPYGRISGSKLTMPIKHTKVTIYGGKTAHWFNFWGKIFKKSVLVKAEKSVNKSIKSDPTMVNFIKATSGIYMLKL